MKKLATVVIFLSLLLAGCFYDDSGEGKSSAGDDLVPGAGAEDYTARNYEPEFKLWEDDDLEYADADKTYAGDSKLCWAAVAANLITWAGWAADENDVYGIFKSHFENKPGFLYDALSYYFDNYVYGTSAVMVSVREIRSHKLLDFIVSALHDHKGVAIKIARPGEEIGHFLSVYGYRYLEKEDNFILYFTDSDDGSYQMRQIHIEWSDLTERWEILTFYRSYYLEYAISLARA